MNKILFSTCLLILTTLLNGSSSYPLFPELKFHRKVHIICTAALIDDDYEIRKNEYLTSLEILRNYGYHNPYIIESINENPPTFLNDYSKNVLYPNVNNPNLRNKGVNEAKSIAESFKRLSFHDDDMIIKITGRYFFKSDKFLKIVEEHPNIDAFVKLAPDGQVYTGCFAMRYKYFKEMLNYFDYEKMEREMINIEQEVADYIQRITKPKKVQVMHVAELGIVANIFGTNHREKIEL